MKESNIIRNDILLSLVEKKILVRNNIDSCILCQNHSIRDYKKHLCAINDKILFKANNRTTGASYLELRRIAKECKDYGKYKPKESILVPYEYEKIKYNDSVLIELDEI